MDIAQQSTEFRAFLENVLKEGSPIIIRNVNQEEVLKELHKVLKPEGAMYFSDHHMKEPQILPALTENGLFKLMGKGRMTFRFSKS